VKIGQDGLDIKRTEGGIVVRKNLGYSFCTIHGFRIGPNPH